MWSRALRRRPVPGVRLHRTVRFARKYNGHSLNQHGVPHTTYFQQPAQADRPPRRTLSTVLLATGFFLLGSITGAVLSPWIVDIEVLEDDESGLLSMQALKTSMDALPPHEYKEALNAIKRDRNARHLDYVDLKTAQRNLEFNKGGAICVNALEHCCTLPSNVPCEDASTSGGYTFFSERSKNWDFWCIFDGHAGPRTAQLLTDHLPGILGEKLYTTGCMTKGTSDKYNQDLRHC